MKKKLIVMALAVMLAAGVCQVFFAGNRLFAKASPSGGVFSLYTFDGESGKRAYTADKKMERKILSSLSAVKAKKVTDWTPETVTFPLYGLEMSTTDGSGIAAAWSNGYLILRDGSVYRFDFDFDALQEYDWTFSRGVSSVTAMPCGRYLVQNGDSWIAERMAKAKEPEPPENITMALLSAEAGGVTVAFTNSGDTEWTYGRAFTLHVLLDGVWYAVPELPTENWGTDAIGLLLLPGETREMTYGFTAYGVLPHGTYRLVANGLTAEFNL